MPHTFFHKESDNSCDASSSTVLELSIIPLSTDIVSNMSLSHGNDK